MHPALQRMMIKGWVTAERGVTAEWEREMTLEDMDHGPETTEWRLRLEDLPR